MAAPEAKRRHVSGKPKKRKSFLQNAKGMGRKGNYGHGTQMDQETYDYYVRIMERLKGEFDSPEEKESLVKNALFASEDHELDHCSNQIGSRVIEALIRLAPPSSLVSYMEIFSSNLRVVATNKFSSHVLQALLEVVSKFGLENSQSDSDTKDSDEEPAEKLTVEAANKWVLKVARFMLNNLDEFIWDEFAIYPTRSVLLCLAGVPPAEASSNQSQTRGKGSDTRNFSTTFVKTEDDDDKQVEVVLPEGFREVLKDFYERLSSWPQFADLAYTNSTSSLLQTLLKALSKVDRKLKKKFLKQIIDKVFSAKTSDENGDDKKDLDTSTPAVPPVFTTDASIRLLESALEHATSKYVTQIYAICFMGRIVELTVDRATNFAVQRLLACVGDPSEFEKIFDELAPGMDKVIASGHTGVLLSLCQVCKRLSVKQGDYIQNLMKALNCLEPAERRSLVAPLILRLCTFEDYKTLQSSTDSAPVAKDGVRRSVLNLHGSLIVQCLLTFKKPIKIVNSLLEMPGSELKFLMCDQKGAHVMTAFVKSEHVGEKSRERLLHRLLGSYVEMACSKYGSFALEAIYDVSSMKNQMKILEELSTREALIMGTNTGRGIANKYSLDLFRQRRNEWKQLQTSKQKTKDMFADITGPLSAKA